MAKRSAFQLSPVAFLQNFLARSLRAAGQLGCSECDEGVGHIEYIGLTAGPCLEDACRRQMGLDGPIDLSQYAEIILSIENQIGGNFSRASSESGMLRVVNTCCPFGEVVKEVPNLCRVTSSVFGAIAARNFGYAKVDLRRRIAAGDGACDVCIYTDREQSRDLPGDEYQDDKGVIVSRALTSDLQVRVEEKMQKAWCVKGEDTNAGGSTRGPKVIAESETMRQALEAVEIVAPTNATVLVSGETGVGKEIIARAVHALSNRCQRAFVAVNCGAIAENLVESALFGHEKGAFTGAYDVHHGLFERAEGGTLFLDEIDCLPFSAQAKLLRVLQDGEFERVGGRQTLRADVRIVAASNRNIEERLRNGEFRRDLYYRLNVVPIYIPPLRERRDDLNALVKHFLRQIAEKHGQSRKFLGERAWKQAMEYPWPGNVRELENLLERSFLFSRGPIIESLMLNNAQLPDREVIGIPARLSLRDMTRKAAMRTEEQLIRSALESLRGNVSAVARHMGISPRAVHQKLKKHAIDPREFRKAV